VDLIGLACFTVKTITVWLWIVKRKSEMISKEALNERLEFPQGLRQAVENAGYRAKYRSDCRRG
jgi:hypothetical protein